MEKSPSLDMLFLRYSKVQTYTYIQAYGHTLIARLVLRAHLFRGRSKNLTAMDGWVRTLFAGRDVRLQLFAVKCQFPSR